MIVCLKVDGSITVELKKGAISRTGAREYFKENYIYNFYAKDYSEQRYNEYSNNNKNRQVANYYSNASAIYLGELGANGKTYFAFSTNNNDTVVIDIYEYIKTSNGCFFESEPGENQYIISHGKINRVAEEMNTIDLNLKMEDGTTKVCKSIEITYSDGRKTVIPISPLLDKEGYKNYTVVNE